MYFFYLEINREMKQRSFSIFTLFYRSYIFYITFSRLRYILTATVGKCQEVVFTESLVSLMTAEQKKYSTPSCYKSHGIH